MVKSLAKCGLTELINSNRKTINFSIEKAREKVEELLSQPLLPAEQEKTYNLLDEFVGLSFVYQLSQKYPLISSEIFNLKRKEKMKVENNGGYTYEYTLELPVVVKLPLEKSNQDKFSNQVKGERIDDYNSKNKKTDDVKIFCSTPEITPEARSAFAEAVRFSAELTAKAYQDKLLSRILVRDRMHERNLNGPLAATYDLVWAPSTWNAEVIEKDPAIFMNYFKKNFLVYNWKISEERSLDAMLREFREDFLNR